MGSLFDDWIADGNKPKDTQMVEINGRQDSREPFITGSRIYGIPKKDSDLDMVIIAREHEWDFLVDNSEQAGFPVRYGKLNLILCRNHKEYDSWKEARDTCLKRKNKLGRPLTKDEACLIHDMIHEKNGTVVGEASGEPEGEILPRRTYRG
jgi:hypothetical protein